MKPNQILILGSVITIILILLWQFEIIGEPIAALGSAVLTFMGFLIAGNSKPQSENSDTTTITQINEGTGDNVGRDKIVK